MNTHIIQRQIVEVTTTHSSDAFGFKEQLSELCQRKLLVAIEKLFDAMAPRDKVIRINKLTIDVGELSLKNWEGELIDAVIAELSKRISGAVPMRSSEGVLEDEEVVEISEEENIVQSIIYFLKHGSLPWFSSIQSRDQWQESFMKVLQIPSFLKRIKTIINSDKLFAERLVNQLNENVIESILSKEGIKQDIINELKTFWYSKFDELGLAQTRRKRIFYTALILCMDDKLEGKFNELVSNKIEKAFQSTSKDRHHTKEEGIRDRREFIFVDNAGLVILHPFLTGLFANVGYTEKDEWISEEVQYRALALTQYLVTGVQEFPEFDLMLNKILIGYPLENTVPSEILLSDFEKDEANDLLRSIVRHWTALKNTSVEGLQTTFLKREGKLSQNENGWLLQVEQKTVDILMNKLPWGISIIKTPWMDEKIHVEWN